MQDIESAVRILNAAEKVRSAAEELLDRIDLRNHGAQIQLLVGKLKTAIGDYDCAMADATP